MQSSIKCTVPLQIVSDAAVYMQRNQFSANFDGKPINMDGAFIWKNGITQITATIWDMT